MKLVNKKRIINFIAIMIAAVFLVLPLLDCGQKEQYDIVFLGDSIIGNAGYDYSIAGIAGQKLGKDVFNGAFGGTTMSVDGEAAWGSVTSSQWCMAKLADAIAYDDWKAQLASMSYADYYGEINRQAFSYFKERMEKLSCIDFSKVQVLVIEHGTNDYNCGRALDNPENPYDITTFAGALRHTLSVLHKAYPEMRIILVTPMYCELGEGRTKPCYLQDYGAGTLDDYVALEKQIAEEFGVVYIDAYRESGIWEDNAGEYLYDGLHPNMDGIALLGDFMAKQLSLLGVE